MVVDRAPITMDDLKNLPDAANSHKSEDSNIAFIELSTALDDPFDSSRPPDSPSLDTYDATRPCYLFAIPRELRDMISDYTVSIGGIQILQTSKKLREEGTHFLYKRRTCHLDVDLTKYVPKFRLQKPIAALIQNVNIDISLDFNVDPLLWTHNIKPMGKFFGAIIPRQTCRLTVLYRNSDLNCDLMRAGYHVQWMRAGYHVQWIMAHIRTFVGFSHLILENKFQVPRTVSADPAWSDLKDFLTDSPFHQEYLGLDLGPCTRHDFEDSRRLYLEFHPRGYWEANPRPLSGETQRLIDHWTGNTKKKYFVTLHFSS